MLLCQTKHPCLNSVTMFKTLLISKTRTIKQCFIVETAIALIKQPWNFNTVPGHNRQKCNYIYINYNILNSITISTVDGVNLNYIMIIFVLVNVNDDDNELVRLMPPWRACQFLAGSSVRWAGRGRREPGTSEETWRSLWKLSGPVVDTTGL